MIFSMRKTIFNDKLIFVFDQEGKILVFAVVLSLNSQRTREIFTNVIGVITKAEDM